HRQDRIAEGPEVAERRFKDISVVEAWYDYHLGVELNAALSQPRELLDDVRNARVVEEDLPRFPWRGVHGDIERRQPIFENPLEIALFQVREGREIPVGEGEPVVVVANVQRLS